MRFPDNSRVCFIGDSLTHANKALPRIIDFYNKNFEGCGIRFFNCGTAGGTYKTAIEFFYDDVLRHRPTHAVVAFGVNDANRWLLGDERSEERLNRLKASFEDYKSNVRAYCKMLSENGISIILCTPAPYDEHTEGEEKPLVGGYALILGYAQFIREFAMENNIPLCDYHDFIAGALQSDTQPIYSRDRVHPTEHGYYLLAKCFLAHQGYAIDDERAIPEYFSGWASEVEKMRLIYGAEQMVVRNYRMPLEDKMSLIEKKVKSEDWGYPVFEQFIRAYAENKRNQDKLYEKIDELYENDILQKEKKI